MASPAQIAANRANAEQSTGPRTLEGKARSSRNRLTHGLCGAHTVLPGEDPGEYEHLLNALLEEHKPAGPTEILLVAQLAQAQWKLNRVAAIEAELFAKQILQNEPNCDELQSTSHERREAPSLADAFEKAQKTLAALARHEAAARRAFDKALANLWKLQGPRRRHDVERAAQSELENFIDAYVNAPMPGTSRHDSYGPRATSHEPGFHRQDTEPPLTNRIARS